MDRDDVPPALFIHPSAEVEPGAVVGAGTRIWHQAHIRTGAQIGEGCTISKDVYIDRDVRIGNRVKIQNGVSVYRGVVLEDDTFVGPHVSFTNDPMPRSESVDWELVPTYIRQGAAIGANATIICGVTLGPYSMVAAGSTVANDVPPHGLVIGNPARLVAYICRRGHRMDAVTMLAYTSMYRCPQCHETLSISVEVGEVES